MTADITALKSTPEALLIASGASPAKRADIFIESSPDALDETQFATQRDLAVTLLNRETKMRRRVERALQRTEDGGYGICLGCEPISAKRLQAVARRTYARAGAANECVGGRGWRLWMAGNFTFFYRLTKLL